MRPKIQPFFDSVTGTVTYVIYDEGQSECAIIDAVLDYDPRAGRTSTVSADKVMAFVRERGLRVEWILETHAHADHLSAATHLRRELGGRIAIGENSRRVQGVYKKLFNLEPHFRLDGSQFDHLFADGETFVIGKLTGRAMHVPGHTPADMAYQIGDVVFVTLYELGFRSIVCHRPNGEAADQPTFAELAQAADRAGIQARYQPIVPGQGLTEEAVVFGAICAELPKPVRAYCRTGTRSSTLWATSRAAHVAMAQEQELAPGPVFKTVAAPDTSAEVKCVVVEAKHTVMIVGGGASGIAVASSLRARDPKIDVAIIDPADAHYYQPGWTLVGAGVFDAADTARTMTSRIPRGVHWIKTAVVAFEPDTRSVVLEGGRKVRYERLVVCPGIKLDWQGVEGLVETLGRNGVASNYRFDLAPYTAELVKQMRGGKALFTQPPMPIKCAGAPQKAMYLSCDTWRRSGVLRNTHVQFFNAGAAMFGVAEYMPALMKYVESYGIDLRIRHTLKSVDGPRRVATFERVQADGSTDLVETDFDMIHVVPPQTAPDFVRSSPLADAAGWIDVDPGSLRHKKYEDIYALGDAINAPNAKTAAAARKQAPVVAHNVLASLDRATGIAHYDGYGSCPLTVERGKVVLAEFLYGGKLAPSFPAWLIDGTKPSRLAWFLKERVLPPLYWNGMLKGREWMARPACVD